MLPITAINHCIAIPFRFEMLLLNGTTSFALFAARPDQGAAVSFGRPQFPLGQRNAQLFAPAFSSSSWARSTFF
jgi:hypothetical protein